MDKCPQNTILIGLLIGFVPTILTVFLSYLFRTEKEAKTIATAIKVELIELWERYHNTAGKDLEDIQKSDQFISEFIASRDYFQVYDSSVAKIPLIRSRSLSSNIIKIYINLKGFLDTWSVYNKHFIEFRQNIKDSHLTHLNELSTFYFQGTDKNLKEILTIFKTDILIGEHEKLKKLIHELITEIEIYEKELLICGAWKRLFNLT